MDRMKRLVASSRLPDVASQSHEHHARWTNAQTIRDSTADKTESAESFNMAHGMGTKLGDPAMRLGDFGHGDALPNVEHWGRFSPRSSQAQLHGLQNFSFNSTSVSLDTRVSVSPLPDTLQSSMSDPLHAPFPESFQNALHGPRIDIRTAPEHVVDAPDGMLRPFGNAREEGTWRRTMDEFGCNKPLGLQLPYPLTGGASTNMPSSLAPTTTFPLQENAYLYQQRPYSGIFPHRNGQTFSGSEMTSTFLKPVRLSPPPTASTASTSSGSSSPFTRDVFNNSPPNDSTWKPVDANLIGYTYPAPTHCDQFSYKTAQAIPRPAQDWNGETCDPRGIIGKHEREKYRTYGSPYNEAVIPLPRHSPALSDMSGSSASGDYGEAAGRSGRGGPHRSDFETGLSPYCAVPMGSKDAGIGVRTGVVYRIRKPSGSGAEDEMLGMGLEDVDERALEFTSRQDTKPTRMLRRQCFNCRTWRDVSAWRRSIMQVGHIVCNKCGLYEKAHKKSRPLNDRGEFVRPGKHATKASSVRGRGRVRVPSDDAAALGVGVMRFDTDVPTKMG
ncbi:hypothetical protein JB92DRAFT_2832683 [Gautieria morchelliformis]|nr:hypothetical protein JB92DRAFT_2832683 [Gautieria morchelliformis]